MIPGLRDDLARPLITRIAPTLTFGYIGVVDSSEPDESRLDGFVEAKEAERQALYHIVNTERHAYPNNLPNEAIEVAQFKGRGYAFFRTKICQVVRDAVLQDTRFRAVMLLSTSNPSPNVATATFRIQGSFDNYVETFEIPLR